jgi:hypothetical protein
MEIKMAEYVFTRVLRQSQSVVASDEDEAYAYLSEEDWSLEDEEIECVDVYSDTDEALGR